MVKRVLLTGCCGFIGSFTVQNLIDKGYFVVGIDNMNDYYDVRLKKHRLDILKKMENFKFYHGDIERLDTVNHIFNEFKPDGVINLAARAGVRASTENPWIYLSTNIVGTLNILKTMKDFNVKRFVQASTSSVYAGLKGPYNEEMKVDTPFSPYAASKKGCEDLCYSWHHLYDFDISVVRYFTVYGPAPRPDMSIFRFIHWISNGQRVQLTGDGTQSRDFTYVEDIAEGTVLSYEKSKGFEIFNLGAGENPYSMNQMISIIEELSGKKAFIDYLPVPRADVPSTSADISKAKNVLGWKPETGFKEGLKNTYKWYCDESDWVRNIQL
ncbi:MAG: GDP-mannose 4,6-dehydratase [Deltaproteobacteria bacterium]|nr:GDP-mannose 4,6-dehydratase [Deltaproteobacteria bacterium]